MVDTLVIDEHDAHYTDSMFFNTVTALRNKASNITEKPLTLADEFVLKQKLIQYFSKNIESTWNIFFDSHNRDKGNVDSNMA